MFGLRIQNYLAKNGVNRKELAEKIGVSEQALAWMLDERQPLSAELYFMICRELHLPPDYFEDSARPCCTAETEL